MAPPSTFSTLDYVKAFLQAAEHVLDQMIGEIPSKGSPAYHVEPTFNLQHINVFLGITGDIEGQVNFGMDLDTGLKLASIMVLEDVMTLDEISMSALQEMANMISGNATTLLAKMLKLEISPPSLVTGKEMTATWHHTRALSVPLNLSCGVLTLTAGISPPNATV